MKRNYEIDGDKKWLIRDGKRFVSTEATDCEMELWAALQAAYSSGAEQMRERAAQQFPEEEWGAVAKTIRNLPVGESRRAPEGSK